MRLTLHTDYALRLLMLLAVEPDRLHTIEAAARHYGISRHHLTKVALTLVNSGFVEGVRGRHGGLRLARSAERIGLGAVVRATEDSFDLVECFDRASNTCVIAPICGLRAPLHEAAAAFLAVLDRFTLADLVAGPRARQGMQRLLSLDAGVSA